MPDHLWIALASTATLLALAGLTLTIWHRPTPASLALATALAAGGAAALAPPPTQERIVIPSHDVVVVQVAEPELQTDAAGPAPVDISPPPMPHTQSTSPTYIDTPPPSRPAGRERLTPYLHTVLAAAAATLLLLAGHAGYDLTGPRREHRRRWLQLQAQDHELGDFLQTPEMHARLALEPDWALRVTRARLRVDHARTTTPPPYSPRISLEESDYTRALQLLADTIRHPTAVAAD